MNVVLIEPEIPWNTGNIGRTCVAAGATLHLVGRLGFRVGQKEVRRAGLDYWPKLKWVRHRTIDAFFEQLPSDAHLCLFSAQAPRTLWEADYRRDSWLVFGRETRGLPPSLRERHAERMFRIPIRDEARSLNLGTAAGIVLYEALRRTGTAPIEAGKFS